MTNKNYLDEQSLVSTLEEIFNEIPINEQLSMTYLSTIFKQKGNNTDNELIKNSLYILAELCSPMLSFENRNEPFSPLMTMGNKRSFMPCDLNNEQLTYIQSILNQINQPQLKARIADILWEYSSPRNIENLKIAVENYISIDVSNDCFQVDIYDFWHRAAVLAKLTKQDLLIKKVVGKLQNELKNNSISWPFHKLKIVEILLPTQLDNEYMPRAIEVLVTEFEKFNTIEGFNETEQYLKFIIEYFNRKKDLDNTYKFIRILARLYEEQGDAKQKDNSMIAIHFYKLALDFYRKIPNEYREEFDINGLNSKIAEVGKLIPDELKLIQTAPLDIRELQEQSRNHVKNKKTVFETLMYFSGVTSIVSYEKFMEDTKNGIQRSIFSHITGFTAISSDGREIEKIPALSEHNQDEVLLKTALKNFTIMMQISTQGCIIPALQQIWQEHVIPKDFLIELCRLSKIVPEKRNVSVANALYQGFNGDFGSAIYLLAPQVENIVRQLLKSNGIGTTTIALDGIEHEIGLSSLLDKSEAKEVLGNDLWFMLQAVFSSSLGPNLRNEVGHGLLDDEKSNSIYSVYAWWAILRWVIHSI